MCVCACACVCVCVCVCECVCVWVIRGRCARGGLMHSTAQHKLAQHLRKMYSKIKKEIKCLKNLFCLFTEFHSTLKSILINFILSHKFEKQYLPF